MPKSEDRRKNRTAEQQRVAVVEQMGMVGADQAQGQWLNAKQEHHREKKGGAPSIDLHGEPHERFNPFVWENFKTRKAAVRGCRRAISHRTGELLKGEGPEKARPLEKFLVVPHRRTGRAARAAAAGTPAGRCRNGG